MMFLNLKFINNQDNIIYLLIILLPPALVSGPAIPDVFISIVGLHFLYTSIKKKLTKYFLNPISIIFFIFYFFILLSSLFSEMPFISLIEREALFYFRFYIFSLAVCYFANNNPKLYYYLAISLFITILVISIDGSVEYFSGTSLFGVESAQTRLFSLFIDEPIVGRYISSATILCVSLLVYYYGYENNKIILLIFTLLTLGEVFTFMSGERTAFAMIASFSLISLILIPRFRLKRLIFVFISIFLISLLLNSENRSKDRFLQTVDEIQERQFKFVLASPIHEQHYKSAFLMFKDNPILGIGSNLFRHFCHKSIYVTGSQSCTTHPHHYYFQIIAENGLFGFIIFITFFLYLALCLSKHFIGLILNRKTLLINERQILFYIFIIVMICPIWPSGNFYHSWTNIPLYVGLGFFLKGLIYSQKK